MVSGISFSQELVDEIAQLKTSAAREAYFSKRPELDRIALVDFLCDQVNRLVRADIESAERVVASAGWLADLSRSKTAKGRVLRASGNVLYGKRDYRGVIEKYEAALEQLEADGNVKETIRTLSNGLVLLTHLSDHERGEQWARKASALCKKLGDPLLEARLEFNLGHSLALQDRSDEALEKFQAAYRYFLDSGEATDVAAALRNIAVTQQQLANLEAAVRTYSEAAELCRQHGLVHLLLEVEYNAAYIHFLRGEHERSLLLFDRAREQCIEIGDWHHKALCDLDQAEIYLELNLIEEAKTMGKRAFDQFEALGMPYEATQALTYRGTAAHRAGSLEESLELFERARTRFGVQGNLFRVGVVDLCRARVLQQQGRHAEAVELANSAHEAFEDIGLPTKIATCELMLASLALDQYDHQAARSWCASALEKLNDLGMPSLEYRAHLLAGRAAESAGRQESAFAFYRKAHETLELIRGDLQADDLKIGFSNDQQAVYESLIGILLSQNDAGTQSAALELIQKAKSRSLSDLLATRLQELPPAQSTDEPLAADIRELRAKSNWYQRRIDAEQTKGKERSIQRLDALRESSRVTEHELLRRLRQLQMSDPELSTLQGSYTSDLESLRVGLPDGTQLLEYFIARGSIFVCLIDANRFQVRRLLDVTKPRADYMLLRTQLGKLASRVEPTAKLRAFNLQTTQVVLERLHRALVEPVRAELDGRHLVIAPHGFLHHLPFHALRQGDRHLVDDFSISYAPSATVLHLCSVRKFERGRGALVLGVPDTKAPLIEEEARTVAQILPDSRLFLGADASHETLVRYGGDCRILHLATHGLFRRDNPMFSAIRLGASRLSVFDLYKLKLRADLVVLSGCSTGLNSVQGSDELVGLTRGLLYAGARTVMVSLWDVNDDSTSRFMSLFYRHLSDSRTAADALRKTQLETRRKYPHPYHWAAFVLIGSVDDL